MSGIQSRNLFKSGLLYIYAIKIFKNRWFK